MLVTVPSCMQSLRTMPVPLSHLISKFGNRNGEVGKDRCMRMKVTEVGQGRERNCRNKDGRQRVTVEEGEKSRKRGG